MADPRTREQQAKESDDPKAGKPRRISDHIMPHLLNLYASRATAQDFEIYAPEATFEDPLMRAHGVKQIKSAFYSLSKESEGASASAGSERPNHVFSESKIVEYNILENAIAPGKVEVLIDNKQHYKIFGKDVDVMSLIRLNVEDGKIIRHEDWWDGKPLKNRDTVKLPLVGRLVEASRRGSMLITHAMMGFGKDPKP